MSRIRSVPTLQDVARHAGVSTATVSRCLNSSASVAKDTRILVMKSIQELGYTPNFGARVMASNRTNTIGAIIPTMENAIFARGLQAFQEALYERGFTLLVASSGYCAELEEEQIRSLVARGADGLLLIGHDRSKSVCDFLYMQGVPTLVAWNYSQDASLPSIGFDNHAAMRDLATSVLKSGHRRIGMISGHTEGNDRARGRVEGAQRALSDFGIDPLSMPIVETDYGIRNGGDALETLLAAEGSPTAVLCGNDVLAVGAIQRARKLGIRVPEDLSVTGFDDIELARTVIPPLTTVHVPHREMGRRSAIELADMVEKKRPGVSIRLETSLRLRDTLRKV